MKIEDYILEQHIEGWVVKTPYVGHDRHGAEKIQYKQSYFPRLAQCLAHIRNCMAKSCPTVEELIKLLCFAESIDETVLEANGLIDI